MPRYPFPISLVVLPLLLVIGTAGASAQDRWAVRMGFERKFIDSNIHAWNDWSLWSAEARRLSARGDLALGLIGGYRFNNTDFGVSLGGTRTLTSRTDLRLRAQFVPGAQVLTEQDIRLTIQHRTSADWQASAGYRYLGFAGPDIHTFEAAAARRIAGWSFRLRTTYALAPDADALFIRAAVRLAIPSQDGYVEIARGTGERASLVAIGPVFGVREGRLTSIRARLFPFGELGLSAYLVSHSFDVMPTRIALGTAALVRW